MTADTTYQPPEKLVAIVTGAGRGIGAAIAERLGADGLAVACLDIDEAPRPGPRSDSPTRASPPPPSPPTSATRTPSSASSARSPRRSARRRCWSTTPACSATTCCSRCPASDWDTVMQVHLRGTFLMTRAAQRHMTAAKWGRVVNLSSTSALGNRGQGNYSAAKAGLQGFTKTVAHELGKFGVTCNAVAPGFIVTEMTRPTAERVGQSFEEFSAARVAGIPVQPRRPARGRRRRGVVLLLPARRASSPARCCTSPADRAPEPAQESTRSAVEDRPADVVAQPLVVEDQLADRLRELVTLPLALVSSRGLRSRPPARRRARP